MDGRLVSKWLLAGCSALALALGACASSGGDAHHEAPDDAPAAVLPSAATVANLELVDTAGRTHRMSEFQGRVVLLDFWATWCKPCLQSLPLYDTWQKDLGDKGLVVVAVSVDEEDAPVAEFATRYAPSVTVLRDANGSAAATFGLPKMPTAFVIARDGRVLEQRAGFSEDEAATLRASLVTVLDHP